MARSRTSAELGRPRSRHFGSDRSVPGPASSHALFDQDNRDEARRARENGAGTRYLTVLATAILCYAALGTVLGILPDYVHSLGGGAVLVGFAVGAPALTGAAGRPLGGRIADRVGPAQVVIAGALVMAVGTIPTYVSALPVLIVSRLVVGAGDAMMAATVLWLLRLVGPARRGRAMGHIGLANYAGLTVGPPLSQALAALVVMAAGQMLAVPSLGLLALASVPPSRHGRTAGAFFAYFDADVGLGGPAVGLAARAADPSGALLAAAAAVLATVPVALLTRARAGAFARRGQRGAASRCDAVT